MVGGPFGGNVVERIAELYDDDVELVNFRSVKRVIGGGTYSVHLTEYVPNSMDLRLAVLEKHHVGAMRVLFPALLNVLRAFAGAERRGLLSMGGRPHVQCCL